MGLSRVFGCFKDPDARARQKQKQSGKRTQDGGERPNRVVSAARDNDQGGIEMRSLPHQTSVPATKRARAFKHVFKRVPLVVNYEPEPWSMGAIARRTSQLEPQLAQAASQANRNREEMERPFREHEGELLRECAERGNGYLPRTLSWTEGTGIRAGQLFGLPTIEGKHRVKVRVMTEEEEEMRRREEEYAVLNEGRRMPYGGRRTSHGWTGTSYG